MGKKNQKNNEDENKINRVVNIPVVAQSYEQFLRIMNISRNYQRVISQLAAENYTIQLATTKWSSPKKKGSKPSLSYDGKMKRLVGALLYDGKEDSVKTNYDIRPRFFDLWNEARKANKTLPELGSWMWDGMIQKFNANEGNLKWKRLNEWRVPMFRRFGISILECKTRSYASILYVDKENIKIRVQINSNEADDIILVVAGPFEMKGEIQQKRCSPGAESLIRRFSLGQVEWACPCIRQDKGKLIVDISYKTKKESNHGEAGKTMSVLLCPWHDADQNIHYALLTRLMVDEKTPEGAERFAFKGIRCEDAVEYLNGLSARKVSLDKRRESAYSNHDKKQKQDIQELIGNLTKLRERYIKDRNHAWAKEIVWQANRHNCSKIKLLLPKNVEGDSNTDPDDDTPKVEKATIGPHSWGWHQFRQFLKYKSELKGFKYDSVSVDTEVLKAFTGELGG